MALVDFSNFSRKVLDAVKGKLSTKEIGILTRLFTRVKKRNTILAAGLLSALKAGGSTKRDIDRLSSILEVANDRILDGQKPFTAAEKTELAVIFERANLPKKAEAKFTHNVETDNDELLISHITESIHREKEKKFEFVPERKIKTKTISLPEKKTERQKSRRA
jgi:hypothetical protein